MINVSVNLSENQRKKIKAAYENEAPVRLYLSNDKIEKKVNLHYH